MRDPRRGLDFGADFLVFRVVLVAVVASLFALALPTLTPAQTPEVETPQVAVAPTEPIVPPQVIVKTQVAPTYPPAARAARFEGVVTVEVHVRENGSVSDVKVVKCTHKNVGFEEAAIEATKKWRFEPARKGTEAVAYATKFRLNFRIPRSGGEYVSTTGADDSAMQSAQAPTRAGAK